MNFRLFDEVLSQFEENSGTKFLYTKVSISAPEVSTCMGFNKLFTIPYACLSCVVNREVKQGLHAICDISRSF